MLVLSVLGSLAEGIGIGLLMPLFQTIATEGPIAGPISAIDPDAEVMAAGDAHGGHSVHRDGAGAVEGGYQLHQRGSLLLDVRKDRPRASQQHPVPCSFRGIPGRRSSGRGPHPEHFSAETWRATNAAGTVFELIASGATVLVFIALLFAISAPLTLLVLLGALVVAGILRLLAERARRLGEEAHLANRRMVESCTSCWATRS